MSRPNPDELMITWTVDDIHNFSPEHDLTISECRSVLSILNQTYDEYFGINWSVIGKVVKNVVAKRSALCRLRSDTPTKVASSTPTPMTDADLKAINTLSAWGGL